MLKKKILISLVIIQGLLIIAGIIAIIFGVFYKMSNNDNKAIIINKNIGLNDIYLINENQYQQKLVKDNKAIFQIIDIETNKVLKEIVIEKD
jgi:cell division protein YceG involved in septum cleavage